MSDQQKSSSGKGVLFGTLIGAVIGATAALLFAPKAGRETRSDLNRQWVTVRDKTQEVGKSVKEKAKEVGQTVREQSSEVVGKLKETKEAFSITADRSQDPAEASVASDGSDAPEEHSVKDTVMEQADHAQSVSSGQKD